MNTRLSRRSVLRTATGLGMGGAVTRIPNLFAQAGADLDARLFPGIEVSRIATNGVEIHTLKGGEGPPILLLHGAPQSHFA